MEPFFLVELEVQQRESCADGLPDTFRCTVELPQLENAELFLRLQGRDEPVQVNVLSSFNLLSKCLNSTSHHCHTGVTYHCSHQ